VVEKNFFLFLKARAQALKLGWARPGWAHPLGLRRFIPLLLGLTGI
jgi:hypothetical protein